MKDIMNVKTMSTLDIAELTGKKHLNVLRDTRAMFEGLEIGELRFESTYLDTQNKERPMFQLPKRECLILVSGYSIKLRTKIIDRWEELENSLPVLPQNFAEAMRLAADQAESLLKLESENKELAPKAEALDRISTSDGSLCITNTAKDLQMRPKDLFGWLSINRWIYRRAGNGSWTAYQDRLQVGYLEHKVTVVTRTDGSEKTTEQVRVTSKGLTKLARSLRVVEPA